MCILSKEQVRELNISMLGLGAPIVKDDVGYNIADFKKMELLGRYTGELSDADLSHILSVLMGYSNTQLADYKDALAESLAFYSEKNSERTEIPRYDKSLFRPVEISARKVKYHNQNAFEMDLDVELKPFCNKARCFYGKHCYYDYAKKTTIVVAEYINVFFDYIRQKGSYGYAPTNELKNYLDQHLAQDIEENSHILKPVRVMSKDKNGISINFEYSDKFQNFKKEAGYSKVKTMKDATGNWYNWVSYDIISEVTNLLSDDGYDVSSLNLLVVEKQSEEKKEVRPADELQLVDYRNYNLPFVPYDFQIEDATKLLHAKKSIVGHEMGCGKTMTAVLIGTSIPKGKLVICPESLRLNWQKEIQMLTPDADIRILYSKDEYKPGKDWTIIGYSSAYKFAEELEEDNGINCVFIDEAHKIKSVTNAGTPGSKRAKAVMYICENKEYCYPMTGTPIATSNRDVFNLLKLVNAKEVIKGEKWDFLNFGKEFCDGERNHFGWDFTGNSNGEKLQKILAKNMIRRLKKDALPDLKMQRLFIPIETKDREYKKLERKFLNGEMDIEEIFSEKSTRQNYLAFAQTGRRILDRTKVASAIDLADTLLEQNESVVIATLFDESIKTLEEYYGDDCCKIIGGMSDQQKQKSIDDFQEGKKKVICINIIAAGVGVTLTKSCNMIICSYDYTPANMSQVEARICRGGQTRTAMVHYLYCQNSILDESFMEMITDKSSNIDAVVDGTANTMDFAGAEKSGLGFIDRLMQKYPVKAKRKKSKTKGGE